MADVKKQVMVVAMDDSEHSTYALEWTLDHFFVPYTTNPPFKLMLVHVIPSVPAIVHVGPGTNKLVHTHLFVFHLCLYTQMLIRTLIAREHIWAKNASYKSLGLFSWV